MVFCTRFRVRESALKTFIAVFVIESCNLQAKLLQPGNIAVQEQQNATIMFNTSSRSTKILAANFGLCNPVSPVVSNDGKLNCEVKPKFLSYNLLQGLELSTDLDNIASSYKARVFFTGNLKLGQAWFVIINVTLNDTNTYAFGIRTEKDVDYVTYQVNLTIAKRKVKKRKNPLFTVPTTSTAGRYFRETIASLTPTKSLPRYTMFEVVALKTVPQNKNLTQTKFKRAVKRAYKNSGLKKITIEEFREINKSISVKFIVSFRTPITQKTAYAFLEEAQENNKLLGYNITCFSFIEKTLIRKIPKDSSTKSWLIAFLTSIFTAVLVILIAIAVLWKCPSWRNRIVNSITTRIS